MSDKEPTDQEVAEIQSLTDALIFGQGVEWGENGWQPKKLSEDSVLLDPCVYCGKPSFNKICSECIENV